MSVFLFCGGGLVVTPAASPDPLVAFESCESADGSYNRAHGQINIVENKNCHCSRANVVSAIPRYVCFG